MPKSQLTPPPQSATAPGTPAPVQGATATPETSAPETPAPVQASASPGEAPADPAQPSQETGAVVAETAAAPPVIAPTPAAPVVPSQEQAAAQAETAEPNFLDRALSLARSRAGMQAQTRTLSGQVGSLQAELSQASQTIATLQGQLKQVTSQRDELATALVAAQEEKQTVDEGVTQAMAQVGIQNRDELPAPTQSSEGGTPLEKMVAEHDSCTDPKRKGQLAIEIFEAMKTGGKN